jgi:hypothetical protein
MITVLVNYWIPIVLGVCLIGSITTFVVLTGKVLEENIKSSISRDGSI